MFIKITLYTLERTKVKSITFHDDSITAEYWFNYCMDELRTGFVQSFTITKEGE